MRYDAALRELYALQARGVRMGVQRMRAALRHRAFDVGALPFVVVAGTNGKGSVSAMIAAGLQAAGYLTGLFTSPHLHRFTERVRIAGRPLGTRETARRIEDLLRAFSRTGAPEVTFFELSTLLAVEAFRDHGCDVAVLEVGLGGRLDATNALPPVLTVITRIALDHQQYLGDTLAAIAREKAGILRRRVPLVTAVREPQALAAIRARAERLRVPVSRVGADFDAAAGAAAGTVDVRVGRRVRRGLVLGLRGAHQHDNAACAVAALDALRAVGLRVSDAQLRAALRRVRWPGRLERVARRPVVLIDAAHNPDGCAALADHVRSLPRSPGGARVLVFGAMSDKDYPAMLRALAPCFDLVVYARPRLPRAATTRRLAAAHGGERVGDVARALARARRTAGPRGLVVVAGSIFLVAEARAHVLGVPADPLIRM